MLLMDTRKAHLIKKYIVEIFEKSSDHSTSQLSEFELIFEL